MPSLPEAGPSWSPCTWRLASASRRCTSTPASRWRQSADSWKPRPEIERVACSGGGLELNSTGRGTVGRHRGYEARPCSHVISIRGCIRGICRVARTRLHLKARSGYLQCNCLLTDRQDLHKSAPKRVGSCVEDREGCRTIGPVEGPSDHRAVRVVFRSRAMRNRPAVRPKGAQHPLFVGALRVELAREVLGGTATSRLQRMVCAAHVAQNKCTRTDVAGTVDCRCRCGHLLSSSAETPRRKGQRGHCNPWQRPGAPRALPGWAGRPCSTFGTLCRLP